MNYRLLLEKVQTHVEHLFKTHNEPNLLYHNITHTKNVVNASTQIANHYKLNDHDFFILITSAWFHDIGYNDKPKGHEQISADEAAGFLQKSGVPDDDIEAVKQCILATKMPQQPQNFIAEMLCDADLFHFGTNAFTENNKLMRKEAKALYHKDFSKEEWRSKTIELLTHHTYFTDYCRNTLNAKKQENLNRLLQKQNKNDNKVDEVVNDDEKKSTPQIEEVKPEEKPKKAKRPERGIETMFRVASGNHQRLSDMADNKSHILITVNSIIISVVVSLLLRKLDANNYLTIPAIILLLVSLVTIVLSILATRPNIPNGRFTQEEVDQKKINLLFFGNFCRMSLESYDEGMQKLMNDSDFLYGSLIRDIYGQGVVLGKKYKLLRAAYNIFMFGLIVSVVAFIVASILTT